MHGFNQGAPTIHDIIVSHAPDVILLQKHWLTPVNVTQLDSFQGYFSFGSSAMNHVVAAGVLWGRPYGNVAVLIKEHLRPIATMVISEERRCVIKISEWILCNVYLPCSSSIDRLNICNSVIFDMWSYIEQYPEFEYLIASDFNIILDSCHVIASCIINFIVARKLMRCDTVFNNKSFTYVNVQITHTSRF